MTGLTMTKKDICLLLYLLLTLYTKCVFSIELTMFSLFSDLSGFVCPNELILFEKTTHGYACMFMCAQDESCEGIDFNEDTNMCHGCKGLMAANCYYEPTTFNPTPGTRMYAKERSYLVSGILPISNDDLSVSSYDYRSRDPKLHSSYYSRYCTESTVPGTGSWVAYYTDTNQWIEARFLRLAVVRGIYLLPRAAFYREYIRYYRLLSSTDCEMFDYFRFSNGTKMVFSGNANHVIPTKTLLPSSMSALCVRINPTSWNLAMSLRFDVIGHYP